MPNIFRPTSGTSTPRGGKRKKYWVVIFLKEKRLKKYVIISKFIINQSYKNGNVRKSVQDV